MPARCWIRCGDSRPEPIPTPTAWSAGCSSASTRSPRRTRATTTPNRFPRRSGSRCARPSEPNSRRRRACRPRGSCGNWMRSRSGRSWAAAAWGPSTWPTTSAWAGRSRSRRSTATSRCNPGRSSASCARRAPPPASSTTIFVRSIRWARSGAFPSSPCRCSRANRSMSASSGNSGSPSPRRCESAGRSPWAWRPRTRRD